MNTSTGVGKFRYAPKSLSWELSESTGLCCLQVALELIQKVLGTAVSTSPGNTHRGSLGGARTEGGSFSHGRSQRKNLGTKRHPGEDHILSLFRVPQLMPTSRAALSTSLVPMCWQPFCFI